MEQFFALAATTAVPLGLLSAWQAIEAAMREQHPHLVDPPPPRADAEIVAEDADVIAAKFGGS